MYHSVLAANNKGADQTARMHRLICAFVVRIWYKIHFLMAWLIYIRRKYASFWFNVSRDIIKSIKVQKQHVKHLLEFIGNMSALGAWHTLCILNVSTSINCRYCYIFWSFGTIGFRQPLRQTLEDVRYVTFSSISHEQTPLNRVCSFPALQDRYISEGSYFQIICKSVVESVILSG